MSIYTTPLQIGYFFSLIMWVIFMIRGYRQQRLSDKLLGWIMLILALELQDYTFGFAGINVLWEELKGFPRSVKLLFGPLIYLYFRAQVNRSFRVDRSQIKHFVPWSVVSVINLVVFVQGPEAVDAFQTSSGYAILSYMERAAVVVSVVYYLSKSIQIYRQYRRWSLDQFSNQEMIEFTWFRNFLYAMIFWLLFRELMNILDAFYDLNFYQEWWWNLALSGVSLYIGLAGYAQPQPAKIGFGLASKSETSNPSERTTEPNVEKPEIAERIEELMSRDRLYLQPDLTLQQLAQHLQTSTVAVSAAINQTFHLNFNDYINSLRIENFISLYKDDKNSRFTLLSLALDSGFNSKATFNRAFKKIKGCSPKEYFAGMGKKN
jgi:AraC-like DNA-binding protein